MAKKTATRSAQWPLLSEFYWSFDDTMVDVTGVLRDLKTPGTYVLDIINIPPGATIEGGEVVADTAVTGSSVYTAQIGDATLATRYSGALSLLAAARAPLVPTGYLGTGENIRMTLVVTGAATAGKGTVRVWYSMRDRANETIPN